MTNYGFCGPMTDMSTVFDAKSLAATPVGGMLPLMGAAGWLLWVIMGGQSVRFNS